MKKNLWKLKYHLLGIIPKKCPHCGGEVTEKGFVGHNNRHECRECGKVIIGEIII